MTADGRPRGIRNNNPGNLRPGSPWQGLANPSVDESNYLIFTSPAWGIRALAKNLLTQQNTYGLRTVRGIISKYAPATENLTVAYINAVSQDMGVTADQLLNLHNPGTLIDMVRAIIRHENGQQPYDVVTLDAAVGSAYV
jgi:hypothetical protein